MGEIKLFNIKDKVIELEPMQVALERELQNNIEKNMYEFFGVTFLSSEYTTTNGGRIDSLGIDEDYCPAIFEYKRSKSENVINQGLFYLDWLMDHKAAFQMLVMDKLGKDTSDKIDWSIPRLICVANDFTKYDEYAVNQINRNIDLVRYKQFGKELLLFELIHTKTVKRQYSEGSESTSKKSYDKTFAEKLDASNEETKKIFEGVQDYILSLGDDIQTKELKLYVAFKKIKNFICAEVYKSKVVLYMKLNPEEENIIDGFTRDVKNIGHFGTGDFEVTIKSIEDFEKAKLYIDKCYNKV